MSRFAKHVIKIAVATSLLAGAGSPALASNTNGFGPISTIFGTSNGAVIFTVTAAGRSAVPACAQNYPSRWVIDASTVAGQAAVAVLLSAWTAHKQVWVNGVGACGIWGDTETVSYFNVQD